VLSSLVLTLVAASSPGLLPVPFVPQQKDTCAAAALSMVMAYHGREVPQDAIAAALVEKDLRGIRGSRLADFARERGMVALVFAGDLALLREHLGKGRPLVLSIAAGRGRYHDVVAIGVDDAAHALVVHDPAEGPARAIAFAALEKKWRATGHWTLLVQPAGGGEGRGTDLARDPAPEAAASSEPAERRADTAPPADAYDALVAAAVEAARAGDRAKAARLLDEAVAKEPRRPEAWTERGGVRFLDGRYADAAGDLRRALAIREDAYARDLLAAALQLDGRELEALSEWNALGKPELAAVEISGLARTRDEVARREIGLDRGDVVTPEAVRAARRRLEETGAFERVTLRTAPGGDGTATLSVALAERHGLGRPLDLAVTTGVNLAWQRLRLRFSNIGGTGLAVGGSLRWQENRPEATLQLQAPRPFGVPATLRLTGLRGEQAYLAGAGLDMRRRGVDATLRHVLDGDVVASLGVRARDRSFSRPDPAAPEGLVLGFEAGIEARLVDTRRQKLSTSARLFGAPCALGSDVAFGQADAELRYEAVLSRPEGRSVERTVIAARVRGGWGSDGLPIDEMYAPGISPESDLPLRAHPLTRGGALGANAMGRSVALANLELRQRIVHRPAFDVSVVAFTDAAHVGRAIDTGQRAAYVDAGVGLRIALLAGPTLRVDQAWGLLDGRRALFIGLGQTF
jgi:hypothetical protein